MTDLNMRLTLFRTLIILYLQLGQLTHCLVLFFRTFDNEEIPVDFHWYCHFLKLLKLWPLSITPS